MAITARQALRVGAYIFKQKFKGNQRYPLVLMLEPLFRCNLACVGCGKIQYPGEILKKNMPPEDAFRAIEECGAPIVVIAGGEPLMHPEIEVIAQKACALRFLEMHEPASGLPSPFQSLPFAALAIFRYSSQVCGGFLPSFCRTSVR